MSLFRAKRPLRLPITFLATSLLLGLGSASGCIQVYEALTGVDLKDIRKRGKLQVVTSYSANSYFLYRGQPMGYEYELLSKLVKDLGVKLELIVTNDMDNIVYMLNSGHGDLVAANLAVTLNRARQVEFTDSLMSTRQVLVQQSRAASTAAGRPFIADPINLIGRKVHVRKGSVFYQRLRNLQQEIGGYIRIRTVPGTVGTERLIRRVSEGKINYTVADEPTALINRAYYKNIDVSTPISFPQRIAWVVRKNSPELRMAVNKWIHKVRTDGTLASLHYKYYRNPRAFETRVTSRFSSITGGKISQHDELLKREAKRIGWDWRLLASLIYQESRFNPRAKSWAGAVGLMQLMPATANLMGIKDPYNPEQNIRGGVKYLKELEERWHVITDRTERLKFVLASYNAGHGHVEDARNLARSFGKNPDTWDGETAPFILKLADPAYYSRREVKHGYCRGDEPFKYVSQILDRYEQYKRLLDKRDKPS